jgi:hypothetical protein
MGLFLNFATAKDMILEIGNQIFLIVLYTVIFCGVGELGSKLRETSQHTMLKGESEKKE